ncbi:hypothetical protein CVS53_03114 [Microbacterium oxydans]|nr:hypothetical protein CVS53_03114 [Microbacterium oxydans]
MARMPADRMLRSKVLADLPTTPGQSLVLLCLRSHADATGVSWPSQDTIASETGMQRSGVRKALTALVDQGIIQQLSPGSQGSGNSARYLVKFKGELWATG